MAFRDDDHATKMSILGVNTSTERGGLETNRGIDGSLRFVSHA